MPTDDDGHRATAVTALSNREYERTGDAYTRAAWRVLAEPRPGQDPFAPDERGWVGEGLAHFVVAAVAYRVAGRPSRATRRGVEGVAIARDLATVLDEPVQQACLDEFVADCRAAGGTDGVEAAYDEAVDAYESLGDLADPSTWTTTPLFEAAAAPIGQVARGSADGEIAVGWDELHGPDPAEPGRFLSERARYKRRRFPSLIERAVEGGHLAAPRGTTEYAVDGYHCPNCAADDVNRVAGATLCLRCSTPIERD